MAEAYPDTNPDVPYKFFRSGLAHSFSIEWEGIQHRDELPMPIEGYLFEVHPGAPGFGALGVVPRDFALAFHAAVEQFFRCGWLAGCISRAAFDRCFERVGDYAARLHDLDRLVKEADNSPDIETKGANSILVYRIAYGAAEYRTSLPEFQDVPWATPIRKLEEAGVPDSTTDAIKANDTLMNGPCVGQDTHTRGYFGPGILDAQVNTLQAY
jgi:hypothetical protein